MDTRPPTSTRRLLTPRRIVALLAAAVLGSYGYVAHFGLRYTVRPVSETTSVPSEGDAADDACVWVAPDAAGRSLILGTDKKSGICIFDLDGKLLAFLESGRINNIDLRSGFPFEGGAAPIVAATNKTRDTIDVFRLDVATPSLVLAYSVAPPADFEPDGLCLYHSARDGAFHAIATSKLGRVVQFRLGADRAEVVRDLTLGSESEGCVADDELGRLYVSEENVAIWRFSAEPADGDARVAVDTVSQLGRLEHDIEGLALYRGANGAGYLVVSSQGRDEFVAYDRAGDNAFAGRFRIAGTKGIDAVRHTDGLEIVSVGLGASFPSGLMVVQDDDDGGAPRQNFKLVSWADVEAVLRKPF